MNEGQRADFADHLATLWRRKGLILVGTAVSVIGALLASLNATKIYEASSVVWVEESKIPQPGNQTSSTPSPSAPLKTFIGIIGSKYVAEQALKSLSLDKPPYSLTVWRLLDNVNVSEVRGSGLIRIRVRFPDAKLTADIANSIGDFAVARNKQIFNTDIQNTQTYLKNALDQARVQLDNIRAERMEFQRTSRIEMLEKELEVLLKHKVDLEGRYFQVDLHLRKLKNSPAEERFLQKQAQLTQLQREVDLDALKERKESLLGERRTLSLTLSKVETGLSVEQARLQILQGQLKNQKRVEIIKRSVIDHPQALLALKEAGRAPAVNTPRVQFQSEEFNPVYRSTEEALLRADTAVSGLRAERDHLKRLLAGIEKELPRVNESLAKNKLKYDQVSAEYELARFERDRQVTPWKARAIQTGSGSPVETLTVVGEGPEIGTEPVASAGKAVLEGELKVNTKRLSSLQVELAEKVSRLERLNQTFTLARDSYNLYARKYDESLLWVASRGNVITVVDRAFPPVSHVSPRTGFNLIAGLVIGLLFFSFLVLSLDYIAKVRSRMGLEGGA